MKKNRRTDRIEQVIRAAKKMFAAKGFQESTISEIAKEAGLSEPTIYEYFSSKEEILFAIPGESAQEGMVEFAAYLPRIKGAMAKLHFIVYSILMKLQTDPEYAAVSYLILKQNRKFTETSQYRLLRDVYRFMNSAIEEGVESGVFQPETDPFFIKSMILGTIEHLTIRKLLYNSDENLMEYVDPIMDSIERVIQNPHTIPDIRLQVSFEPNSSVTIIGEDE
jgi:TetR/AcrR family fatty acid metabolism transcriptional regulator